MPICELCKEPVCPVCHKCMNPTCPNIACDGAIGKAYDCRYLVEKDRKILEEMKKVSRKKERCNMLLTALMAVCEVPFIPWFIYRTWKFERGK